MMFPCRVFWSAAIHRRVPQIGLGPYSIPLHKKSGDKSPHSRVSALCMLAVLTTLALAGCHADRGPDRVVVSGTITYQGKPLPAGSIRFVPLDASLPGAAANIVDGKYRADNKGGVPVGTHKIQIEGCERSVLKPNEEGPPVGKGRGRQYLPKRYNADTQLEITIPPGSRAIIKNFDLTD